MKTIISFFCLFCICFSSSLFQTAAEVSFFTGLTFGTAIKISPDESTVIVGFQTGAVRIYDMKGYYKNSYNGHNSSIVDVEWPDSIGPITLDTTGLAIRWSYNGSIINKWNTNKTSFGLTVASDSSGSYLAICTGSAIYEYELTNGILSKTYLAAVGDKFTSIQYASRHVYLFANVIFNVGTITSYCIRILSCYDGKYTSSSYTTGSSLIKSISLASENEILLITSTNSLYTLSTSAISHYLGVTGTSKLAVACPSSDLIALAETQYNDISIYNNNGGFSQYLKYLTGYAQDLDCSNNKLVSIDNLGYVTINKYEDSFPTSTLLLIIIGSASIFIICCIVVCCAVHRKRKLQRTAGYGKIVNQVSVSAPTFPNQSQGYNQNPNPYAPNAYN